MSIDAPTVTHLVADYERQRRAAQTRPYAVAQSTFRYVDPVVGGGFSHVTSYLVLIAALLVRPHGLFGRAAVARV